MNANRNDAPQPAQRNRYSVTLGRVLLDSKAFDEEAGSILRWDPENRRWIEWHGIMGEHMNSLMLSDEAAEIFMANGTLPPGVEKRIASGTEYEPWDDD